MSIQILSDLHLESPPTYETFTITPKAPYLALLGNIGTLAPDQPPFLTFLTRHLKNFRAILFVPGNHEPYASTWPSTLATLRTFEQRVHADLSLGEFVLLDRKTFELPGANVVVVGCTLFSAMPAASEAGVGLGLDDFFRIGGWDLGRHNEAHGRDLRWLNAKVEELEGSGVGVVVLTHWGPTRDLRSVGVGGVERERGRAFATDLEGEVCFRRGCVRVWGFGHTRVNCDFLVERGGGVGPLRLVSNQRGYYFAQVEGYDGEKVVDV